MEVKIKIGVVVTGEEALDKEAPRRVFDAIIKKIDTLNIEKIIFQETLSNSDISKKASRYFSENNVDLLLVGAGTWTQDNFLIDAVKFLNCPIIFWSPPDPLGIEYPSTGALVGTMQNGGVLSKMGKKVKIILDDIEGKEGFNKLKKFIKILTVIRRLKFLKVGIIGSRCPGMLDSSFHELELMNQIGPEVVPIGTVEVLKELNSLGNKDISIRLKELIDLDRVKNIEGSILVESVNIYFAIKKIVKNYNLGALAIRCWPDFKNVSLCAPCFTLSRLSTKGIMGACEADVTAAISMYILNQITGNNVYLGDMLKINKKTNEALYYHCGATAEGLAKDKKEVKYKVHGDAGPGRVWKPGLTVEFPLKPGRITFARIGEVKGKYKMVTYSGNAIETEMFTIGNPAKVILDKNPEDIVNNLIEHGLAHHQIGVHGDITDDIKILCDFLNINLFSI